jgi:curved DNA-binding protein CbpA
MASDPASIIEGIKGAGKDYYGILGVAKDATQADIKKQYRKLALLLHPDKCNLPGAEEAFKSVSSAYSCLGNESSRQTYDLTGGDTSDAPSGGPNFHGVDPQEIFEQFFRQQGGFSNGSFGGAGAPRFVFTSFGGMPGMQQGMGGMPGGGGMPFAARSEIPQLEVPVFLKPFVSLFNILPAQITVPLLLVCVFLFFSVVTKFILQRIHLFLPTFIFAPSRFRLYILLAITALGLFGVV